MATVFIAPSSNEIERPVHESLVRSAKHDRFGIHRTTDNPEAADICVFTREPTGRRLFQEIRESQTFKKFSEKCFVFSERDVELSVLPGLYTSIRPYWYRFGRVATGCYPTMYQNEFIESSAREAERLMAFVGSLDTSPVRTALAKIISQLPATVGVCIDTSAEAKMNRRGWSASERESFRQRYAEQIASARFILCPRGWSPSTVRLFETMRAGRVPVIISDAWVPPKGPAWDTFSVRIAESDLASIPQRLADLSPKADEMGRLARAAWADWYADDVLFHRVVDWCLELKRNRRMPERLGRNLMWLELLVPINARNVLRDIRQRFLGR